MRAVRAGGVGVNGVTAEAAALDHVDARQYIREGADHGGLRCALLAPHQDATNLGRHRCQDQGECHVVGADDCGERKRPHLTPFLRVSTPAACMGKAGVRGMRQRPATADVLTPRVSADGEQHPSHSGGTAPDLHRIPLPSPPRIMSHSDASRGARLGLGLGQKRTCTFVPLAVHTLQHAHRDCNARARAFRMGDGLVDATKGPRHTV